MKILIVSHSSGVGGAEEALKHFVNVLEEDHQVEIVFPSSQGESITYFVKKGIKCSFFPARWTLPDLPNACMELARTDFTAIASELRMSNFDVIISNTTVTLHGGILARLLGIPHVTYIHEHIRDDDDLSPMCVSSAYYNSIIEIQSDSMITCSKFVRSKLLHPEKATVLYPYPFAKPFAAGAAVPDTSPFNLMVIGTTSIRKNAHFAVTVLKSLRLRGRHISLHFIGNANTGSQKLERHHILRGEPNVFFHTHLADPYVVATGTKRITLVCAVLEPFGLTVPESMARGIPVVASRSGGPEELLDEPCLYNVGDIGGCVRAIERIIDDYQDAADRTEQRYESLSQENNKEAGRAAIRAALEIACREFLVPKSLNAFDLIKELALFKNLYSPGITPTQITTHIASAANDAGMMITLDEVANMIATEVTMPGSAVSRDIAKYDVVPFTVSPQLELLYKEGIGLAIELAATYQNEDRVRMAAIILLAMREASTGVDGFRILALGDGLGIDALRMASCGYTVDYMDYDSSLMTRIARKNCASVSTPVPINFVETIAREYDAVICLEVIEHVADVPAFSKMLYDALKPGGMLFISECFGGIADHWPTHLYLNEQMASMLPVILQPDFDLIGYSISQFGKPYIFRKVDASARTSPRRIEPLFNRIVLTSILQSRLNLGI